MKKTITALSLAAALLLSGCSGVSQESGNSATDESSSSQTESSSSSTATSSSTSETSNDTSSDNKALEEDFNAMCKSIAEQVLSFTDTAGYSMELTEPNVNYNDDICLSKIYVAKVNGNDEDERILMAFLDINSTDEYEYFQSAKNFINFVDENALEICGRNQYMIAINPTENGDVDISIITNTNGINITYANRAIRSAYSDRFKSMDLFKDCNEQISLSGLIKFEDLPKNCVSYDISCEFQGKTLTHKWYQLENGDSDISFVTYIDDGTYDDMTDEELIFYAYMSIFDEQNKLDRYGNNFYYAYKSGEKLACSIIYYDSSAFRDWSSCRWIGEYERLNSHDYNIDLSNILTGKTTE